MVYRLKEFEEKLPAMLYAINLFKINLTEKDIFSIKNTLRRYCKKYPYVSYLLVVSNTDSKYCTQREIRIKGKRGRPKTIILGNKIPTHIHLSIMGNKTHSAYKYVKEIIKAFNKRFNGNICSFCSKGKDEHAKNFIDYSLRQANSVSKNGIFNKILETKKSIYSEYF